MRQSLGELANEPRNQLGITVDMRGFEDEPIDWAPASRWKDDHGVVQSTVEFIVPGRPVPKGSVVKSRWGNYHDTAKGIDEWLAACRSQAQAAMRGTWRKRLVRPPGRPPGVRTGFPRAETPDVALVDVLEPFEGSVMVDVTFVLRRPSGTPKTKTPPAIKKPDLDKLLRAVGDALTGIVYHDDSQIVEHHVRKRLADVGETPGAIVLVTTNVEVT